MSIVEIMFSPTGGTKKVSFIVTNAWTKRPSSTALPEHVVIDLLKRDRDFSTCVFSSEDICIVSVPSYGGRVPETAVSRLGQMRGNGARAVAIVVYGNRDYDDTFAELQDTLEGAGFVCVAGIAAVAEHSIMRQFAAGRPDRADEEQLSQFVDEICKKLEISTAMDASYPAEIKAPSKGLTLPGSRPYRKYGGVPMKPQTGSSCTRCGLCADECPVGAIPRENPSKTDTQVCISCMRCISICPEKARSVNKALLAAGSLTLKKACSVRKENTLFLP